MPDMMFQALDPTGLNETAEQVRAIVQAAKADIEEELDSLDYAQPDGIYPDMTVGAVIGADETAQWATRESTGTGSATVRSVQGAAVAWNQIVPDANAHKSGTAASSVWIQTANFAMTSGHKYLLVRSGTYADYNNTCRVVSTTGTTIIYTSAPNTPNKQGVIFECTETRDTYFVQAWVVSGEDYDFYLNVFDLTTMFGSGNEPQSVAEFERMFPAAYYPYSAPTLKPVQIAGIASTDAQDNALDSVEWETQTLWGAGAIGDMLYSDHKETRVGVVDLGTLTWAAGAASNPRFQAQVPGRIGENNTTILPNLNTDAPYTKVSVAYFDSHLDEDMLIRGSSNTSSYIFVRNLNYPLTPEGAAAFKASLSGYLLYYELATPTTTPISPALPMTYRVQQGGAESIIVPEGEISAAPILTVADPVNMGAELAQIWAAIEALQANRGSALGSVRNDSDVSSTEVKEAPTMDEKQTTERESEI